MIPKTKNFARPVLRKNIGQVQTFVSSVSRDRILQAAYRNRVVRQILRKSRTLLNLLLPGDATWVKIRGGAIRGYEICAELRNGEKSYWLGMHEFDVQAAIRHLAEELPHLNCIYDVGAHIGFFSMVFAHCFQEAHVFAFEPNLRNYGRLVANIGKNRLAARISPLEQAISERSEEAQFYLDESSWSGSLLPDHRETHSGEKQILTTTLDDAVFRDGYPPPQLIKIDVEGAEGRVLRGSTRVLDSYKPVFLIELHYPQTAREVLVMLRRAGYCIEVLREETKSEVDVPGPGYVIARYESRGNPESRAFSTLTHGASE